jgi:hypothetical protein
MQLCDGFVQKPDRRRIAATLVQPGFLVQTVRMPAVRVHCHGPLSAALATGSGRATPNETYAAPQANVRTATTSALRVQKFQFGVRIIVFALLFRRVENRSARAIIV